MTRLVETATTSLDQATAFANVAEFANIDLWDPGVVNSVKETSDPTGVGTSYALDLEYGGRKTKMRYTITEWVPNEKVVLIGEGGIVAAVDTISFAPEGDQTLVTYEADLRLTGIARLAQPFMKSRFDAIGKSAGDGLRRWLSELETSRG